MCKLFFVELLLIVLKIFRYQMMRFLSNCVIFERRSILMFDFFILLKIRIPI